MPEDASRDQPVSRRLRHAVAPGVDELTLAGDPAGDPPHGRGAGDPGWGHSVGDAMADRSGAPASARPAGRPASGRLPGPNPFDPGRRGVRALAVVTVIVVLVAAYLAWRARPVPERVPDAAVPEVAVPAVSSEPQPDPADPETSGPPGELVVAVAGKVRRPGLVRLPAGARVADALEACGGLQPGAEVALLNLARKVTDGELILVGVTPPPGMPEAGAAGAGGTPGGGAAGVAEAGGPVNLNTATLGELDGLPGVGPVLAQRILDHRERHGAFRAVGDLRQVDGIGETRFERLKALVTV